MTKAMYAFSGDPIHYGHIDIIERAAKAFDKVIVGFGVNARKQYLFSLEERTEMARRSLAHLPNIEIISFGGLLVDYAYEHGIPVIVKGVRSLSDFDYENVLHHIGKSQKLGIDTHVLFAKPEFAHISSSIVKEMQINQGMIHEYVPLYVKQCLEARISKQYIVGVTGEIASGKSYVSKMFEDIGRENGIPVYNIELDDITHHILTDLKEPVYQEVRETIVKTFGGNTRNSDGTINRKALGEIVFNNSEKLEALNRIMYNPLLVRLRRELFGKEGLMLLNAALIAESRMSYLCNNNVVLVYTDKKSQERRLKSRELTEQQIRTRLASQYNFEQKKEAVEAAVKEHKHGKTWVINNSDNYSRELVKQAFDDIIKCLGMRR